MKRTLFQRGVSWMASNRLLNFLLDEQYLKCLYWARMGKKLDLDDPQTFNQKLQWLKIHDRKPEYTTLVDKYAVRQYISDVIGEQHLIPLVGGPWTNFNEIDFEALPNQFVLKCTHDSGGLVICRDKSKLDVLAAKKKISNSLKLNYYDYGREWQYKNVKPKIIAEQYMEDCSKGQLIDYKFYCFNQEPKCFYASQGLENHATAHISFYDLKGHKMPFKRLDYLDFEIDPDLPENYEQMLTIARRLANKVNSLFVRVDLYEINGKVYFSEITFHPCSGFMPFDPIEWDYKFGNWLNLPKNKNET